MTAYSVTEIETFHRCPRRWRYSSMNHLALEPVLKAPALVVGTLVHKVLPDWALGQDPIDSLTKHSANMLIDIVEHYTKVVGCKPADVEMQPIYDACTLSRAMIENYVDYYKTPVPDGFRLVASEQTIVVNIPGTKHCVNQYCNVPTDGYCTAGDSCGPLESHQLEGTLDGVLADDSDNLYVFENKTWDKHPNPRDLANNQQFLRYMWALQQVASQISPTIKELRPEWASSVRGICYNGLWKRTEPPKTYQGRKGTMDDLFIRTLLVRNQQEIQETARFLAREVTLMAACEEPDDFYKVVPALGGCWDCSSFYDMCCAESRGEDISSIINFKYAQRQPYYNKEEEE